VHAADLRVARSADDGGGLAVRVGVPLADIYLEFLGGRCRPNTVLAACLPEAGPRPDRLPSAMPLAPGLGLRGPDWCRPPRAEHGSCHESATTSSGAGDRNDAGAG
jgi:hypothetical protein